MLPGSTRPEARRRSKCSIDWATVMALPFLESFTEKLGIRRRFIFMLILKASPAEAQRLVVARARAAPQRMGWCMHLNSDGVLLCEVQHKTEALPSPSMSIPQLTHVCAVNIERGGASRAPQ